MKTSIDIYDSYLKTKYLSAPDAELLEEIGEIKKAFKYVNQIKAGKLKSRPAEELLNEITMFYPLIQA